MSRRTGDREEAAPAVPSMPKQDVSVRFSDGPLDNHTLSFESLKALHDASWPSGLAPSEDTLRCMFENDIIFGAFDPQDRLVAALHGRIVERGWSVGANDIAHGRRCIEGQFFPPPVTDQCAVVCHAAITHPSYRRGRVTQRLITEHVLPYLGQWERTSRLPWLTSSPLTHVSHVGRALAANDKIWIPAAICDHYVSMERPLGYSSMRDLIDAARPYLEAAGFDIEPCPGNPGSVFALLFESFPTHSELFKARHGSPEAQKQASFWERRAQRLYLPPVEAHGYTTQSHLAALILLYLAVASTQAGAYQGLTSQGANGTTGHPIDPILRFHVENGGRLHPTGGPLPNSRPEDVSALFYGQLIVYATDWDANRRRYGDLVAQRQHTCINGKLYGPQIDWNEAEAYLRNSVRRSAKLALQRLSLMSEVEA